MTFARIGITTSFEGDEQRLALGYIRAVEAAGGLPVPVPMLLDESMLRDFASLLDGLVISGGPAITQGLVGRRPEDLAETDPVRAASDRRMVELMQEARKPVLGICYGMQLLNALAGGTIYADVERQVPGTLVHAAQRGGTQHGLHPVPGTHLARLLGTEVIEVNTRHVQAVATLGAGFRLAATAPDGTVEAIEQEDGRVIGVQFHPERMGDTMAPLFRHLVSIAASVREELPISARSLQEVFA